MESTEDAPPALATDVPSVSPQQDAEASRIEVDDADASATADDVTIDGADDDGPSAVDKRDETSVVSSAHAGQATQHAVPSTVNSTPVAETGHANATTTTPHTQGDTDDDDNTVLHEVARKRTSTSGHLPPSNPPPTLPQNDATRSATTGPASDDGDPRPSSVRALAHAIAVLRRKLFETELVDGPITLKALGALVVDQPAYWTPKKLYPVGFETRTLVHNIPWTCRIERSQDATKPVFVVALEKAPATVFRSFGPTKAWKRAMAFLETATHVQKKSWRASATSPADDDDANTLGADEDGFGLLRRSICRLVEGLDHAAECTGYVFWDERHGATVESLTRTKKRLTKQVAANDKAQHEPKSTTSVQQKIDELRRRRQQKADEKPPVVAIMGLDDWAVKTRHHEGKTAALLQWVDDQQAKRLLAARAAADRRARHAIYLTVKSLVAVDAPPPPMPPPSVATNDATWTRVAALDLFPADIQRDVLWCWDFLVQYADILRFRAVVPLPLFCQALALHDKTAPQGDTVLEETNHGRLLATLHVVLLETLLVEFTPYLTMSVAEFKKCRPLNVLTWPEVARQMCMVAWDVDKGDVDGHAIKLLKGSKSSSDNVVGPLRDTLQARGDALLANTAAPLATPDVAAVNVVPKVQGFGVLVSVPTWDALGLVLVPKAGYVHVHAVKDDAHPTIKDRVTAGDTLVCVNGLDVANMGIDAFNEMVAAVDTPIGLLFAHADDLIPHPKPKPPLPILQRCATALKILRGKDAATPFNAPVDADLYPDYYTLIPDPMDLATIEDKILGDEYDEMTFFVDDVQLVWKNCFAYNGEVAPIAAMARKLSATFDRLVHDYIESTTPFKDEDTCRVCRTHYCKDLLLLCDRCDGAYHTLCLRPPLKDIPQGEWYCPTCAPFQPEKDDDDEDDDDDDTSDDVTSGGLPHMIRLLSKESYMELTLEERVTVFKGLCELVQMCSSTQSVTHMLEDLGEDQRRDAGCSYADVSREWDDFDLAGVDVAPVAEVSTDFFNYNGVNIPITDALLVHLKGRALAVLEKRPLPPSFLEGDDDDTTLVKAEPVDENVTSDDIPPSDNTDDDNDDDEARLLEEYADIQLATRSAPTMTYEHVPTPRCHCCQLNDCEALGDLVPAVFAPATRHMALHLSDAPPPILDDDDDALAVCHWTSPAPPFKYDLDDDGRLVVTDVADTCAMRVGDVVVAINMEWLNDVEDEVEMDAKIAQLPRPMVLLAAKTDVVMDGKQCQLLQLPATIAGVDCPNVVFASGLCRIASPATGIAAIATRSMFPHDVIYAIDGTRVTTPAELHERWQPNAIVCLVRHPLDRGVMTTPLDTTTTTASDVQVAVWQTKTYDMAFHAGPLGLALELEANVVVVRSLTSVSQATNKVHTGDVILAINDKPIGLLNELTQFTQVVKSVPRPVTFRFYRPATPLVSPTPTSIRASIADVLATPWLDFDGYVLVAPGGGSASFAPGDALTHLNGVDVQGMTLAWLHDTLGCLPRYDFVYVDVRPCAAPDDTVHVHASCVSLWNDAISRGTQLQTDLTKSKALEAFLKDIAPRTWPLTSTYYRFPGDPNVLYKLEDNVWWTTNQIAAVAATETPAVAADLHKAFLSPPSVPTSGPFALRSMVTVTSTHQHESFVLVHGRQYYLGTFATAHEAELSFDQCKQRFLTTRLLLAPFSTVTFPRVPLPMLKADDFLKRLQNMRRYPPGSYPPHEPKLSIEMKEVVRYGIRAPRPKPQPATRVGQPPGLPQRKRPLEDELSAGRKSNGPMPLSAQMVRLNELKGEVKEAWGQVQSRPSSPSCVHFTTALQSALACLTMLAQHMSKNPQELRTPATFVALHHATVMCVLSILLSEALAKASPMSLPDLQLMHTCGDNLVWSIENTLKPDLHSKVLAYCMDFASKLPTLKQGLSTDMELMVATMDTFFKSANYLAEPPSFQNPRPLFAMLSHASHEIQPLPPMLTQELWKLQTCTGNFERMLRKHKIVWPPGSGAAPGGLATATPQPSTRPTPIHTTNHASRVGPSPSIGQDTVVSFDAGPLGIIIQQDDSAITVSSFAAGDQGQAIRSGKIAVGDVIVAVNGDLISKIGIEGFKNAVTSGIRPLQITFRRPQEFVRPVKPIAKPSTPAKEKAKPKDKAAPRKRAKSTPQLPPTPATQKARTPQPTPSRTPAPPPQQQQQPVPNGSYFENFDMANETANTMGFFSRSLMDQDMDLAAFNTSTANLNMSPAMNITPMMFDAYAQQQAAAAATAAAMWAQSPQANVMYAANNAMFFPNMYMQPQAANMQDSSGFSSSFDPSLMSSQANQPPSTNNNQGAPTAQPGQPPQNYQAYYDPQQYYNPTAFRSGPPVEFVAQVPTPVSSSELADNNPSAPSPQTRTAAAPAADPPTLSDQQLSPSRPLATPSAVSTPSTTTASHKTPKRGPKKATEQSQSTGRRSTRVSKKPDMAINAPLPVATPTVYIPGAGTQGDFATDALGPTATVPSTRPSSHAFAVLQASLLAIEAALPRDAFRHNKWTRGLRAGWAEFVVHATTSRALLEATLVLESQIETEYLDATWKAQSSMTIKTLLPTATMASAAMRLHALDDALSFVKPMKARPNASYKRKLNVTTRRDEDGQTLPPLPELTDPLVYRLAVQKLRAALALSSTQLCRRTLSELSGLTQLPTAIVERWYKQCLDTTTLPSIPPTPLPKKPKIRGRRPKNLEYRYVPDVVTFSPALLADPELKSRLVHVLETLKKTVVAAPFAEPVDTTQLPEYKSIVTQPMDLGTLVTRIQNGAYDDKLEAILEDMQLIWANCVAFNGVQAEISGMARRCRSIFQRLMEEWVFKPAVGTPVIELPSEEQCRRCRQDTQMDQMLMCDSCDAAFHSFCVGLPAIPTGNWFCIRCVENRNQS
ncbi:Aste57867_21666 [Aphanomyces stellatus]|uniref:Aste57867_21666 protein n=1 Tax=Aphanomyces stellatus TaxID=120398 RepID=A0A485LI49_9STRA|nr:hypothetical protein As57867_021597 [Aphanomyces stellatus]VFT98335.1 Aste57867_21666 [Aphanomyces stellatus]